MEGAMTDCNSAYALITGGSSGIGLEIAKILAKDYHLVLVGRRFEALEEAREEILLQSNNLHRDVITFPCDVACEEECIRLHQFCQNYNIEVVIHSAGVGVYGQFLKTSLDKELAMIQTNVVGMHILMKLFLEDFVQKEYGYFLNVASSAGYMPGGPNMAAYYASKAYTLSLTRSVMYESQIRHSKVYVGALCPGPVVTGFQENAGIHGKQSGMSARDCAVYAVHKMFRRKPVIIPGKIVQLTYLAKKLVPDAILLACNARIQAYKDQLK